MTKRQEKINLDTRIGDRFEPIPITPRQMVEALDCDDTKIKGLALGQTTYKLSDRFYKTLAAELGIPYGVFGFFTPLEVMERAAEKEPLLPLRVTVDTAQGQALGLTQDKGLPMPVKYIENVLHEDRRLQEVEYGNGELSADDSQSGCKCLIDTSQNVASTSKVNVTLKIRPYGYARYIDVELGFLVE